MKKGPPPALAKAMARSKPEVPKGKLEAIKRMVKEARDLNLEKDSASDRVRDISSKLSEIVNKKLPDLMEGAGVPSITIESEGNAPAYEAKSKPFYSAGIRSDWPREDRERAFDYLTEIGHGELIKTSVTFDFPKDVAAAVVERFLREVRKIKLGVGKKAVQVPSPSIERGVNAGTLKSWLKEQIEVEGFMPKLDIIGGFVGKVVEIKEVKEKKPRGKKPRSQE